MSLRPFLEPVKDVVPQIGADVEDLARFLGAPVSFTIEPAQA